MRRLSKRAMAAVALVGGLVAVHVQGLTPVTLLGAAQADAEKAVLQAITQINDAFQRADVKAYDALTTSDFIRVGGNGRMFSKAVWLKNTVPNSGPPRRPGTFDETSVRVYGDAAVVTYRNTPVNPDGKPGPVGYMTRVLERQAGQWKLAFAQSTDLKAPSPATGPAPPALPAWSASTPLEKEALAAFEAIQNANQDRDVAAWERLSAPDHLIINVDGTKVTRAQRVASLKAPPSANAAPAGRQTELRMMVKGGTLAVASWHTGTARALKVMVKRGTGWQQVLQQSSPVVAPKA
jgi:ketosteroid isomerase-like protein